MLDDPESLPARIFDWCVRLLRRRANCSAFHPDAPQVILDLGPEIFALERISTDGSQTVLCLFNFTAESVPVPYQDRLAELFPDGTTRDLVGGSELNLPADGLVLRPYQALWLVCR